MRTTMVYSLLRNAARNADVGRFDLKIFETGRTFIGMGSRKQPREQNRAAFLTTGRRYEERWHFSDLQADFYDLQRCVENILDLLRIPAPHSGQAFMSLSSIRENPVVFSAGRSRLDFWARCIRIFSPVCR